MFDSLFSLLWVLVCVLVIVGLAYWFTKYVVGRGKLGGAFSAGIGGVIEVKAQTAVGRDRQLLLVKAGKKYLLLGSTANKITKLAEFTAEEAQIFMDEEKRREQESPPSFRQSLQTVLRQKTKR